MDVAEPMTPSSHLLGSPLPGMSEALGASTLIIQKSDPIAAHFQVSLLL